MKIWVEVTIAGFFYLLSLFFLILFFADIKDLEFLSQFKELTTPIYIVILASSYLLGILAHRLIPLLHVNPFRSLIKWIKGHQNNDEQKSKSTREKTRYLNQILTFQYGSDRLHRELDFQFSLFALLSSLSFAMPFLGVSLSLWLSITGFHRYILPAIICFTVLTICCIVAVKIQWKLYLGHRDAAYNEMQDFKAQNRSNIN